MSHYAKRDWRSIVCTLSFVLEEMWDGDQLNSALMLFITLCLGNHLKTLTICTLERRSQ